LSGHSAAPLSGIEEQADMVKKQTLDPKSQQLFPPFDGGGHMF
jgi:hypothetical protein